MEWIIATLKALAALAKPRPRCDMNPSATPADRDWIDDNRERIDELLERKHKRE